MNQKRRRIRNWPRFFFPAMVTLVIAIAIASIFSIQNQMSSDLKDKMITILKTTQQSLHVWGRDTRETATFWAAFPDSKRGINGLLNSPKNPTDSKNLNQLLTSVVQNQSFLSFFIMDNRGILIGGYPIRYIGKRFADKIGFGIDEMAAAKSHSLIGLPFHFHGVIEGQIKDQTVMVTTAPVQNVKAETIAILGFYLNPRTELFDTMMLGRLGATGETYAFDRKGRLLTQSRFTDSLRVAGLIGAENFEEQTVVLRDPGGNLLEGYKSKTPRELQPLTRMAQSAVSGKSGSDLEGYRDYRGVPVVGAWLWDEELGLGLATEIDSDEAYRTYYYIKNLVMFMLVFTILGAILISSLFWKQSRKLINMVSNLESTKHELQNSLQARNEFISVASHELRTPLTSLRMQLDLINRMAKNGTLASFPRDKLARMTEVSSQEIGRFSQLITNLLDVSMIVSERFPLILEKFDLRELVSHVVENMSVQIASMGCSLITKSYAPVQGSWDRFKLEQVLINLLSNAAKYGRGKPIEIQTRVEGDHAILSVTDHGIGIKEEDRKRIFERFERIDKTQYEAGLGLGLYIVKKIIEDHYGTIRVESEPGKTTTFIVTLPLNLSVERGGAANLPLVS